VPYRKEKNAYPLLFNSHTRPRGGLRRRLHVRVNVYTPANRCAISVFRADDQACANANTTNIRCAVASDKRARHPVAARLLVWNAS
jgi:hypothetical protein